MHIRRSLGKRSIWLAGTAAAAGLVVISNPAASHAAPIPMSPSATEVIGHVEFDSFQFAYDGVLGTSMDLTICAPTERDAEMCNARVLAEIERLRAILSTYDSASEISRVKAGASIQSPELAELLGAYDLWNHRSGGAIRANMADTILLWKRAQLNDQLPDSVAISQSLDAPLALNVDALGKGYIIDRAVEIAQQYAPAGLLNIGGDIRAWGDVDWRIGVSDPTNPAENAPLAATFTLRNSAAATSGGYARYYSIQGQRFSHIIDPRTGMPVKSVTSATVIADNCMAANAMSTAASVLGGIEGAALAAEFGRGHLLLADAGQTWTGGPVMLALADTTEAPAASGGSTSKPADSAAASAWAKDFQVTVKIALKDFSAPAPTTAPQPAAQAAPAEVASATPAANPPARGARGARGGRGAKRPYVAVWIEDKNDKVVRTITIWGDNARWVRELSYWWRAADGDQQDTQSITRATRAAGEYAVTWDGKDEFGKPVAPGDYTVVIEVNREHGRHVKEAATITCDGTAKTVKVSETAESAASTIEYGPKPQGNASASNTQARNAN